MNTKLIKNNGFNNSYLFSNQTNTRSNNAEIDYGIRITDFPSNKFNPDIYENIIVWEDDRNVNEEDWLTVTNLDIYGYDLSTNQEFPICTNPSRQSNPKIYADKIVWQDYRNDPDGDVGGQYHNADIYLYDLTTNEEIQITRDDSDQYYPDIYDNYIVWVDMRDNTQVGANNQNIYIYNLETHEEQIVTEAWRSQTEPSIFGNYIVWEDWRYFGYSNIYYYDMTQNEENYITRDNEYQYKPEIHQNKIVWDDGRNGNYDIFLFDLDANEEIQITNNSELQEEAHIFDNIIIWTDHRNRINEDDWNTDIYAYDLIKKEEIQISKNKAGQGLASIYKDKIICSDGRNNNTQIYLYELSKINDQINHRPIIRSLTANPEKVEPYEISLITVDAFDMDGDRLFFSYQCSGGFINGNNSTVIWEAPEEEGNYIITVTVSDNEISSLPESINIIVEKESNIINDNEESNKETDITNDNREISVLEKYGLIILSVIIVIVILMIIIINSKKKNI